MLGLSPFQSENLLLWVAVLTQNLSRGVSSFVSSGRLILLIDQCHQNLTQNSTF